MEDTSSPVPADPVEVYLTCIRGNEQSIDQEISVQIRGASTNKYNCEEDEELARALMHYYYNFRPYVTGSADNGFISSRFNEAGTMLNPNLDRLMALSKPAPFGRGDQTVYDESVRRARSIQGNVLRGGYGTFKQLQSQIHPVASVLHAGKKIRLELSKLHIYEEGGHFAPHRDTLRSEDHLGSIVVLFGSAFTGGEFFINGEHCPLEVDHDTGKVPFVAFHTDILHEIRPVTSGVRVSLQFDVFHDVARSSDNCLRDHFEPFVPTSASAAVAPVVDEERCDAVVAELTNRLRTTPSLIIPTYHRYPQHALHNNILKPVDDMLLRKLESEGFTVTPVPLNLVEEQPDGDCKMRDVGATLFWQPPFVEGKPKAAPAGTKFVVPSRMEGMQLFFQPFEHMGNEAQPAIYAYYLSGLLVTKGCDHC